jgi:hypothetical protein
VSCQLAIKFVSSVEIVLRNVVGTPEQGNYRQLASAVFKLSPKAAKLRHVVRGLNMLCLSILQVQER